MSAARRALELDPDFAKGHVLLADVYQKRWQWGDAEAEYKQALQLSPNDPAANMGFAGWLICQGRTEEAIAWSWRARELDPLGVAGIALGRILFQGRHYDESSRELRSALAVHPESAEARFYLGFALIGNGQPEMAITNLEQTVSLTHRSPGSIGLLAAAYGFAGRRNEALRLINELKQGRERGYVSAGAFINPYLTIRDYNEVFL